MFISPTDRERNMAKNRGICAAHTCIPQNREYPGGGGVRSCRQVSSGFFLFLTHCLNA